MFGSRFSHRHARRPILGSFSGRPGYSKFWQKSKLYILDVPGRPENDPKIGLLAWRWEKRDPNKNRKYSILTSDMCIHVSDTHTHASAASVRACGMYTCGLRCKNQKKSARRRRAGGVTPNSDLLKQLVSPTETLVTGHFCCAQRTHTRSNTTGVPHLGSAKEKLAHFPCNSSPRRCTG